MKTQETKEDQRDLGRQNGGECPESRARSTFTLQHIYYSECPIIYDGIVIIIIIIICIYIAPQNPIDAIVQLRFTKIEIKINVRSCKNTNIHVVLGNISATQT